jgi:hypothetical protein
VDQDPAVLPGQAKLLPEGLVDQRLEVVVDPGFAVVAAVLDVGEEGVDLLVFTDYRTGVVYLGLTRQWLRAAPASTYCAKPWSNQHTMIGRGIATAA